MIRILALALFCVFAIWAARGVKAHEPYSDWKIPGTGVSCCDNRDCGPVRADRDMDGRWIVFKDGREIVVPASRVLPIPSPDGRSHWCGIGEITYCFVPGEVRS